MTKIITGMLVFGLLFLQTPGASKKSERVCYGFVGPVKKATEEFSPVSGYPYLSPNDRCRVRSQVFDKEGKLVQNSYFSGACGSDENQERYTYDQDGNRTTSFEYIQGKNSPPPPPPPMAPPGPKGGQEVKGPPKTTFKYDAQGMIAERANFRANGEPTYKSIYKYDEKGRLQEMQVIHSNGPRYRWTSKYDGETCFPESAVGRDHNASYEEPRCCPLCIPCDVIGNQKHTGSGAGIAESPGRILVSCIVTPRPKMRLHLPRPCDEIASKEWA